MKVFSRSSNHKAQMPATQVFTQLNDQLYIFLRCWGGADYSQKVVDEVTHYISTTQADIEVTTPFDYNESISSPANRTRIGLLLAHDLLYKTDNRTEYTAAFEAMVLYKNKNELAWSSVGRFGITKIQNEKVSHLLNVSTDTDAEVLLPAQVIGLEKEICMNSGSIFMDGSTKVILSSTFDCHLQFDPEAGLQHLVEVQPYQSTYWFSVLTG